MRREAVFSLAGFLGGFVVAAIVFWRPAESRESAQTGAVPPLAKAERSDADEGRGIARGERPVVVRAENAGVSEPAAAPEAPPKRPADLFHEALASLPGMDASRRQAAVNDLIAKLRAAGPEGLRALRDFFRAGQDVKLQGGYGMSNGRVTQAPSLRVALLEALGDWTGPEALELTREVLRSTPRIFEAGIAIRQLEAKAPGTYRAEIFQTLQQLAAAPPDKDGFFDNRNAIFDALGHFKAPELIPAAEKLVEKNGWAATQYLQALGKFPQDVRTPAMERLFSQPGVVKQLAANPWALQTLNYTDPVVSRNVAQIFESGMDRKSREKFLENFGTNNATFVAASMFNPGKSNGAVQQPAAGDRIASLRSKMAFLDQIAPQCTTAVLQERLADAREDVTKAIANPAPKPGTAVFQSGSIGNMVIQSSGGVIQVQTEK